MDGQHNLGLRRLRKRRKGNKREKGEAREGKGKEVVGRHKEKRIFKLTRPHHLAAGRLRETILQLYRNEEREEAAGRPGGV